MLNVYRNTGNGTTVLLLRSRDSQRPVDDFGFVAEHGQESACRPYRNESALFPAAKRVEVEAIAVRELLKGETEAATDGSHVDFGRDMNDVLALVGGSVDKGKRLFKSPDNAFAILAHGAYLAVPGLIRLYSDSLIDDNWSSSWRTQCQEKGRNPSGWFFGLFSVDYQLWSS